MIHILSECNTPRKCDLIIFKDSIFQYSIIYKFLIRISKSSFNKDTTLNMADEEEIAKASEDIEEVKFRFTVDNIKNLKQFISKTVYVRGQPWFFKVIKNKTSDKLGVYWNMKNKIKLDQWAIIASASIKLLSKSEETYLQKHLEVVFCPKRLCRGFLKFIKWETMMDPKNEYINDDKCCFEVKIRAGQLQDLSANNGMVFKSVQQCCDGSTDASFYLSVEKSSDFVGVCSPTFVLGNMPWRISVIKFKDRIEPEKKCYLRILLQNLFESTTDDWSCIASFTCKLISFNDDTQSAVSNIENEDFYNSSAKASTLVPWSKLTCAGSQFIKDEKFCIEIKLKIDEININGPLSHAKPCCFHKFECAICFESMMNRPIACTKCGHMFCKQCIEESLKKNGVCATCNQVATLDDLRTLFFSLI